MQRLGFLGLFMLVLFAGCSSSTAPDTIWEFETKFKVKAAPVVAGQKVYVGSDKLYCLNAKTGEPLWEFQTYGMVTYSAVVQDGYVYFQCGGLYCLDAATGKLVWEFWTPAWGRKKPLIADGYAYSIINNKIYCINAERGKLVWTKGPYEQISGVVVSKGKVYIGSYGKLYCLSARNGQMFGSLTFGRGAIRPVVSNGRVYIIAENKKVHCIDAAAGDITWVYDLGRPILSRPAVSDKFVYISDGKLVCLKAESGDLVWEKDFGMSAPIASVLVDGNFLYISRPVGRLSGRTAIRNTRSADVKINCIDAKTGEKLWDTVTPAGNRTIADGYIYIGSRDYKVYCLKPGGR